MRMTWPLALPAKMLGTHDARNEFGALPF